MRRLVAFVAATGTLMVASAGVALAGGGGVGGPCSGVGEGTQLTMLDSCFDGTAHFADADSTLTVVNDGRMPHTFSAVDGSFDTGELGAGDSAEVTVGDQGIVRVFCTLHGTADGAGMAGVLLVGEPTPEAVAAAGDADQPQTAFEQSSGELAAALADQGETLTQAVAALSRLSTAIETSPAPPTWWLAALAGLGAGGLIGVAGTVAVRRARRGGEAAASADATRAGAPDRAAVEGRVLVAGPPGPPVS